MFTHPEDSVLDLLYIGGTVLFFALMIAFARGCEALGRRASADTTEGRLHE